MHPAAASEHGPEVLLRIEDLHTFFFAEEGVVKAVNGVDLSIRRGRTLGLVGESGCGKSMTALSIMRLVQRPQGRIVKGRVLFDGTDLVALSEGEMREIRGNRISMIYQEPMTSLNPVFSVGNQLTEAIRLHQKVSRRAAADQAVEMLRTVGIPNAKHRIREYPHQMSGGMRQRVMIAMALSCHPQLLIADEPTTALDVTIQAQILNLMNNLKRDMETAILIITHDLGVIAEMAQSVAVMYAGRIVEYAEVVEFFTRPRHPYTLGLMNSIPKLDEPPPPDKLLQAIPGLVPSLLNLPEGCAFSERCHAPEEVCGREVPALTDVGSGHLVRCWRHG